MLGFKSKPLGRGQPSARSSWHDQQHHVDTVVFVHGIIGAHDTTWGQFHTLLHTDPDLPRLDILSWGYRSGFVPGSYQDVETEGDSLVADLETAVREGNHIYLVGHSMGGLVILKGLVNRILNQHGRRHPVTSVQRVVLYASPLYGAAVANVVRFGLQLSMWTRLISKLFPHKQLSDLQRGDFCDALTSKVLELIYRPPTDSLLVSRAIPVRACAAKHDALVSRHSAVGIFQNPAPKYLEGTHTTIKFPEHHEDLRYKTLKNDIEAGLTDSFRELCAAVMQSPDMGQRRRAAEKLDRQYGDMMRRCTQACFHGRNITDDDRFEVAGAIWKVGSESTAPPAHVMAQVVTDYLYKQDTRLHR
jgi:pimeloyl-ACP methyl ester carboxylesterase